MTEFAPFGVLARGCVRVGEDYCEGHFNWPWVGQIGVLVRVDMDEWSALEFLWFDGVSERCSLAFVF